MTGPSYDVTSQLALGMQPARVADQTAPGWAIQNLSNWQLAVGGPRPDWPVPPGCFATVEQLGQLYVQAVAQVGAQLPAPRVVFRPTSVAQGFSVTPIPGMSVGVTGTAAAQIVNTTSAPAYNQDSVGTFSTVHLWAPFDSPYGAAAFNEAYTVISSAVGGYIKRARIYALNVSNTVQGNLYVGLGTGPGSTYSQSAAGVALPASANTSPPYPVVLDFGDGVANTGMWAEVGAAASENGLIYLWGTVVYTQTAAHPIPATIS